MAPKRIIILVFLSSFLIAICNGQESRITSKVFNNITKDDGLPHDHVNDVAEDELGFIWFATNDGLCRYDSHDKIRIFKDNDEKIVGGLQSSEIIDLLITDDNILYAGTRQGGLTIYDIKNDSWETFMHDPEDPNTISNNEILSIVNDSKGRIWIGTENGLNLYHPQDKTFKSYLAQPGVDGSLQAKAILSVVEDNNGWIWAGAWDGGFYLLDINEVSEEIYFRQFTGTESLEATHIWNIYQDNNDNYWIATHYGGLLLMTIPDDASPSSRDWEPNFYQYTTTPDSDDDFDISAAYLSDIIQDDDNNLWIATVNGISTIPSKFINEQFSNDLSKNPEIKFSVNTYDPTNPTSILDNVTKRLYKDSNGAIWIACRSGVSKYNPLSNQFKDYHLFRDDHISPNSNNYYVRDKNKIWIASGTLGLIEFDISTNKQKPIFEDMLKNEKTIYSIYSKDDKTLFISSSNSVLKLDLKTEEYVRYPFEKKKDKESYHASTIDMLLDHKSRLWLCTQNGLLRLDLVKDEFAYYYSDPSDPASIVDNSTIQILQDDNKNLWVTTHNGFSQVLEENGKISFKNYKADNSEHGLKSNKLGSMVYRDRIIYLGSMSGLLGYNIAEDKFLDFRSGNEKLNITSIVNTVDDNIWGSSTNHLFRFNPETKEMITFDARDGVSNSNYLYQSSFQAEDGCVYFGHFTGFTKFDPNSFKLNNTAPKVSIIETRILSNDDNETINVLYENSIEVQPDHYTIDIDFAALDYTRPDKMNFAYILEGFDQDWKYLDKNGSATYTNLDQGEYTFKVKAANHVGIWSDTPATLNIKVNPTLLETTWFQILLGLVSIFCIYSIFKFYFRRIRKRNAELKAYNLTLNKEIEERNKFEKALKTSNEELKRSNSELEQFAYIASHDLQEPLRITGSFIELLGERYSDVLDENAYTYIDFAKGGISRMGTLIKNLLTFSKVGGTVLHFKEAKTQNIVEEKLLDLARLIKDKNADIKLGNLPEIMCEKNQIAMLFYNLINNAIKFNKSEKPIVEIGSRQSNNPELHSFYVRDNGIGIDQSHKNKIFEIFKRLHDKDEYDGTGIGLALCKKIVTRHGGTIWIDSAIGKGTTFNFTLSKSPDKIQNPYMVEAPADTVDIV